MTWTLRWTGNQNTTFQVVMIGIMYLPIRVVLGFMKVSNLVASLTDRGCKQCPHSRKKTALVLLRKVKL